MRNFKIIQIALIAIFCHQSISLKREKRSFWPSFLGGGTSSDTAANVEAEVEEQVQNVQVAPQQHAEIPIQHLSPGYHYPIWRVHKYNGLELKPIPISLVPQQHRQQLHTRVPYTHYQQPFHQLQPSQQFQSVGARQPNGQQFPSSNCKSNVASAPIPPELQELAQQFGIKDASKLPSLEDAMGLLGTTTRAETIQTIKELAATPDGMNLIRQFLSTDEGAAASREDPNANSQCDDASSTQQFIPQQPNNVILPPRPLPNTNFHQASSIPVLHQQYGVPKQYPPPQQQHDVYGPPNAHQAVSFQSTESQNQGNYQPQSHIMSLIKNEAVPHEEYGVPSELSTAQSEHQGYNPPKQNSESSRHGHQIYGLPNMKPAAPFRQEYYAPRSNEYNVPNEVSSSEAQEPHQEYGVPNNGESNASQQQHETYGLPNVQDPVNFLQNGPYPPKADDNAEPHSEYGVPDGGESNASQQQQHDTYGLPNVQDPVNFLQNGPYPLENENVESGSNEGSSGVPHREYNVPNEDNQHAQVPHEVYGIPNDFEVLPSTDNNQRFNQPHHNYAIPQPPQQTYGVANNDNESEQQDQQLPHQEYAVPSVAQATNNVHETYALPHQRFFESPNVFRQYVSPSNFNNQPNNVPFSRQVGGLLDRTHTNLELGQLLTTTLRPEAVFLERVGAWTRYFVPPGPTVPIVPPQVTEDVNETVDHSPNAYTIPIPKIPELNEPQLHGLPNTPPLPNVYIPRKFLTPSTTNQGPFVRVQFPLSGYSALSDYELPNQQAQPFDGQTVEEFVPDISRLPLDQRNLGSDLRTSYGIPTHPQSYAADSHSAASETNEQRVAVVSSHQSGRILPNIETEEIIENDVVDEEPPKKYYGPQRISSYDSYATGKLNRANDDAIVQLIPTQKPYTNHARRLGQVEDASIIDAIATMTSGFRPIT